MIEHFDSSKSTNGVRLRRAGSGAPLLLLHGYPQTSACWGKIAPALAAERTVVAADLPGYGDSAAADGSKRAMAAMLVEAMRELGFDRFDLAGHDRGGRVAYRMALDHPQTVSRLITLDITPTIELWEAFDQETALDAYHWTFLAQPAPLPERMILADPIGYLDWTLASWTAAKDLAAFAPSALEEYRAAFSRTAVVAAACADYRAGADVDRRHDGADRSAGRKIDAPMLAMWSGSGFARGAEDAPDAIWRRWAHNVRGVAIETSGHFLAEEAPDETLASMRAFLNA